MEECIFCKIIKGEIKAAKIYEDRYTYAFLDIRPASKKGGHTLVLPKNHFELITDIPEIELIALSKTIKKISKALLKFGEGLNILQNNKKVAGQYINHLHFHLIPRFKNDSISIEKWEANEYAKGEIEKLQEKIKLLI
ncbi:MAG TPA: HIT family protein [Candidatus Nanoarchaeia archaeon]|nr:HIT family protein [Candidatus Nanoarchaeia archaeon]